MHGSRHFRQEGGGGPRQSGKKALTTLIVCFFLLSSKPSAYLTEVKWLISKKIIILQGPGGGPNVSKVGGV